MVKKIIQALWTVLKLGVPAILWFLKRYLHNIFVGLDQFVNSLMFGDPDETISSRAGRVFPGTTWTKFIDWLMFYQSNHCYRSIEESEGKNDLLFPRR